jgi:hypothetical protein
MGYPDQKDDQDTRVPVEDSERMTDDDRVVVGEVIEPDEDRQVDTDAGTGEPDLEQGESGRHRYSGDELDALAEDPLTEDDQVVLESSDSGPVTPAPAGETVASTAANGTGADGTGRTGEAIPMPASGTADVTYPDPVPGEAPTAPAAAAPATSTAAATGGDQDWREIMATFVDDPRAATERAASMVEGSLDELVQSLRGQQDSLRSSWQGDDADTEKLRTTLKDLRSLWQRLDGFAHKA